MKFDTKLHFQLENQLHHRLQPELLKLTRFNYDVKIERVLWSRLHNSLWMGQALSKVISSKSI
jgi:hypothetical protein